MDANRRKLRRRQLDVQLGFLRSATLPVSPRGGWLKAVREAYGMSLEQFGAKLGVTAQAAHRMEASESRGSLSVSRLQKAADALECDAVVVLIPRQPLETIVQDRARRTAEKIVKRVGHTMELEAQGIEEDLIETLREAATQKLIESNDRRIWEG